MSANLLDLNDVPLLVEARLDCFNLTIEDMINMQPGSVIKTTRAAGDSVDVRVAEQLVCQGEMIVIGNKLAVRLTDFDERS